ncbi:MAG: TetR/AcrR family transcriptional regulator, partial [Woeseia sp.]|nr:TetR/AcrR family transcriptional regulator [Woeseia sp.]
MTSTRTDRYQQQRQHAVRAAASVFSEKGFHGASTRDIAERMGIKQGSLYYYFKSKEEALAEVCMLGIGDYVQRMQHIAAGGQPFDAKLAATIASHLSSYREKNEALKVHNDERLYLPKEKRTVLKQLGSGYRQCLEGMLHAAVNSGELPDSLDCHFAAQSVIGLCNSWGDII